ncbi:hypothetical protein [Gimesia sp.]|uniref:hypothetical protein n=1 Tax=Gimesia sp. TaxID=2024833 RepID=UPI003A9193FB
MKKRPHSIPQAMQAIITFTEQLFVSACDQGGIAFMIIQSEACSAAVLRPEKAGICDVRCY